MSPQWIVRTPVVMEHPNGSVIYGERITGEGTGGFTIFKGPGQLWGLMSHYTDNGWKVTVDRDLER